MDVAKALVILFMVNIHLAIYGAAFYESEPGAFAFFVIRFTGGVFAAPWFMFAMGIGIAFSRKSTPGYLGKRGLIAQKLL